MKGGAEAAPGTSRPAPSAEEKGTLWGERGDSSGRAQLRRRIRTYRPNVPSSATSPLRRPPSAAGAASARWRQLRSRCCRILAATPLSMPPSPLCHGCSQCRSEVGPLGPTSPCRCRGRIP